MPTALRERVREFGCRGIAARAGALAFRPIAVYVLQVHSNLASTGEGTCPRSPFQQLEVRSTQFPDTVNGSAVGMSSAVVSPSNGTRGCDSGIPIHDSSPDLKACFAFWHGGVDHR